VVTSPFRLEVLDGHDLAWLHFERNGDERGWLSEIFNQSALDQVGLPTFAQDNISRTSGVGIVRGLHFQRPPHAQAKLFRVTAGRVYNVVADLRPEGFGRTHATYLTPDLACWLYIPAGFAHGFQALEPTVEVHYKVSRPFHPDALGGVRFDDPDLNIAWPLPCPTDLLSQRDRTAGRLAETRGLFNTRG